RARVRVEADVLERRPEPRLHELPRLLIERLPVAVPGRDVLRAERRLGAAGACIARLHEARRGGGAALAGAAAGAGARHQPLGDAVAVGLLRAAQRHRAYALVRRVRERRAREQAPDLRRWSAGRRSPEDTTESTVNRVVLLLNGKRGLGAAGVPCAVALL